MPAPAPDDSRKCTADDARVALRAHAVGCAQAARAVYGPDIDDQAVLRMLEDRAVVRFPTEVVFDASPLEPGEFAFPAPVEDADGGGLRYRLYVHPAFIHRRDALPLLIAYQLVRINYGDLATSEDAEAFGAALLDLDTDAYYERLCRLADSLDAGA